MAKPLSADRLLSALRAEGCRVTEYKSWRTHNRNHKGAWGPVNGVMIHHTVTSGTDSSVRLCYHGHSSLPGPLCHTVGAKDGRLYMVGHGRANHAGLGDDDVLRAVIAERSLPHDNEANTDGNARFYGIELINLGDGKDPWPEVQVDAAARWAAAICRAHGWNERSVIGHREWQPGKVDPRGFSMDSFRGRVRKLLAGKPGEGTPEEDDVPDYTSLGVWDNWTLEPGREDAIEWSHEYADDRRDHHMPGGSQFVHGPAIFSGEVALEMTGLDEGAQVQVRLSEVDRDSKDYVANSGRGEFLGTAGTTFVRFPFTDHVGKGRGVRVRIKHFSSGPATVTRATLKALVWKR